MSFALWLAKCRISDMLLPSSAVHTYHLTKFCGVSALGRREIGHVASLPEPVGGWHAGCSMKALQWFDQMQAHNCQTSGC